MNTIVSVCFLAAFVWLIIHSVVLTYQLYKVVYKKDNKGNDYWDYKG